MASDLHSITTALGNLSDRELETIMTDPYEPISVAPGFVAWLEHLAEWELCRRGNLDFPLRAPEASLPPEEDAVSMASAWRERFGPDRPNVVALFDGIVEALDVTA